MFILCLGDVYLFLFGLWSVILHSMRHILQSFMMRPQQFSLFSGFFFMSATKSHDCVNQLRVGHKSFHRIFLCSICLHSVPSWLVASKQQTKLGALQPDATMVGLSFNPHTNLPLQARSQCVGIEKGYAECNIYLLFGN